MRIRGIIFNPTMHVHRSKKTGDFALENYAVNPETGFLSGTGKPLSLSAAEMEAKCDTLILENLAGFSERIFVRSDVADWPEEKWMKFRNGHSELIIRLKTPKMLMLQPLRRVPNKNGSVGEIHDEVKVVLPTPSQKLWHHLSAAFERCRLSYRDGPALSARPPALMPRNGRGQT